MATGDPELGGRLRAARRALGLTLAHAAGPCGVSVGAVSYWETGKHPVPVCHLKTLCMLYGTTPNHVLGIAA